MHDLTERRQRRQVADGGDVTVDSERREREPTRARQQRRAPRGGHEPQRQRADGEHAEPHNHRQPGGRTGQERQTRGRRRGPLERSIASATVPSSAIPSDASASERHLRAAALTSSESTRPRSRSSSSRATKQHERADRGQPASDERDRALDRRALAAVGTSRRQQRPGARRRLAIGARHTELVRAGDGVAVVAVRDPVHRVDALGPACRSASTNHRRR